MCRQFDPHKDRLGFRQVGDGDTRLRMHSRLAAGRRGYDDAPVSSGLMNQAVNRCGGALTGGLCALILFVIVITPVAVFAEVTAAEPVRAPRIGLVLGGGGAKGLAHVGVIRVLDEMHIPIHCVAGTSMGALVGGIFASGMPPGQLERETLGIDWSKTVGGTGKRDLTPIDRKLQRKTYTNSFEVGIKDGGMQLASGLLNTQGIEDVIRGLVTDARFQRNFDDLPVPFRATRAVFWPFSRPNDTSEKSTRSPNDLPTFSSERKFTANQMKFGLKYGIRALE